MQSLDLSFMKAFKKFYPQVIEMYTKLPQHILTMSDIGKVFGKGYLKAASSSVAVNGFIKTGLYLFDRNVIHESDFAGDLLGLASAAEPNEESTPSTSMSPKVVTFVMSTPSIPVTVAMPSDLPALSSGVPTTSTAFYITTLASSMPNMTSTSSTNAPHLDLSSISPSEKNIAKADQSEENTRP